MKNSLSFKGWFIPAALAMALLTACGGSDNDDPVVNDEIDNPDPTPTPEPEPEPEPEFYSLSGSVSGLDGSVTLEWSDESESLDANGDFSIEAAIEEADDVELSLSNVPESQNCEITSNASISDVGDDVTGVTVECEYKPSLSVEVANYFNGEAVPEASVIANWEVDGETYQTTGTTDEAGTVSLYSNHLNGRISVTADAQGYGEQTSIASFASDAEEESARVQLLPVNGTVTFTASEGGDLTVENIDIVTVPASAFVGADGGTYIGEITSEITIIDPSSDPSLMPGEFERVDPETEEIAPIESFGAVNITFADNEGNDLSLAQGQTAVVRIPLAQGANNPPDTIPLFFFDDELGYWVEEGEATLITHNGVSVYEGTVTHFTTWNADRVYETVYIQGCVVDTEENAIAGASVRTRGNSYIGTASARTDENGQFRVAARMDSSVYISATSGGQSRTLVINTEGEDITLENCLATDDANTSISLSWGENPRDLDSHLTGPENADGTEYFHLYYGNRDVTVGEAYLYLDVDDTSSFGPEVISIPEFPFPGTYRYGVDRYAGSGTIADSPARVELAMEGDITVYSPPGGEATDCWAVLDIVVDEAGDATVMPVNEWNEAYCDSWSDPEQISGLGAQTRDKKTDSIFNRAVEEKYYAE